MEMTVFKIGSSGHESLGVTIPKALCDVLAIEQGDKMVVTIDQAEGSIIFTKQKQT